MKRTVAAIFAISILGASMFLAHAYKTRGDRKGNVSVTGLGSIDFESDEILWSGIFETTDADLAQAFEAIRTDRKVVEDYLLEKGVKREEITFQQVNTDDLERSKYNDDGKYVGSEFEAYRLSQVVTIDSKDLDLVINISREISELLEQGIQFKSYNPKFYYGDLDKLKLSLIEQASENGRIRAEQIAKNSKSSLKGLKDARLGVFQILGYNSGESYSWSGTFNTSSRWKTANITVKMNFEVE
jgi:hypothetical protein